MTEAPNETPDERNDKAADPDGGQRSNRREVLVKLGKGLTHLFLIGAALRSTRAGELRPSGRGRATDIGLEGCGAAMNPEGGVVSDMSCGADNGQFYGKNEDADCGMASGTDPEGGTTLHADNDCGLEAIKGLGGKYNDGDCGLTNVDGNGNHARDNDCSKLTNIGTFHKDQDCAIVGGTGTISKDNSCGLSSFIGLHEDGDCSLTGDDSYCLIFG